MKYFLRFLFVAVLFALFFGLRFWQAEKSFERQQALFPQPQKGAFTAWVSEDPEVLFERRTGSHATGRWDGSYQSFVREVRAVCTLISLDGRPVPPVKVRCSLRFSYSEPRPVLSYGDKVEWEGKVQAPAPAMNPGQFDYAYFLKTKGVAYVTYVAAGKWKKIGPSGADPIRYGGSLLRWSYGLKRWAEETIYRFLPYPENALLDGILLGVRSPLPDDMVESFFLTGTIHILAVSGMITAFIAGLFFMVMRALQVPRKAAAGAALLALLFFVLMTGAHPPVCRAGLFSALALLAVLFERRVRGGTLLLTTALILLILNPFVVEDLSFQISFLATAGLMVMSSWMMKKLSFLWRPAALLVTATTAAQLAVWCLILYDFNQFSLYSVAANLLIVPLALFATAGGLVFLAGAALHPVLGTLFGAACEAPLRLLIFLADTMARLPKAEWIVASPPLPWVLAFHSVLLFSFYFYWPSPRPGQPSENWKRREHFFQKGRRTAMGLWALFSLATVLSWCVPHIGSQPLRVAFLALDHGNAVVLRSPGGKVFVVDGGKDTRGPDRYHPLVAFLRHLGVQEVEGVLGTHPDEDDLGGLVNLLSAYPTRSAFEGSRAPADTLIYDRFKEAVRDRGLPLEGLHQGDRLAVLGPAEMFIEHPPEDYEPRFHRDANRSVVPLVAYGPFHLLLPGDLEREGLSELLRNHRPFPRVDWLMAPHHGRLSGEQTFCAKSFHPRFVVLSDWRDYPDDHTIFQAAFPGAVVLSTAVEGAIELEVNLDGGGRYRTFKNPEWKVFEANVK